MKLVAAVLLALAAPAAAEPAERSENVALALSIGGTAAATGMLFASDHPEDRLATAGLVSLFVAPSLGHWYAAEPISTGLVVRGAGAGLVVLAIAGDGDNIAPFIFGAGIFGAGALWDIATAPRAARRYNAAHVTLQPAMVSTGTQAAPGIAVGGAF